MFYLMLNSGGINHRNAENHRESSEMLDMFPSGGLSKPWRDIPSLLHTAPLSTGISTSEAFHHHTITQIPCYP